MKTLVLLLLLTLCGCESKPSLTCAIIHKPAKAECPKGYTQEKTPRFTERNGAKEFACLSSDPAKEQCTDVLKGGESVTFRLFE